MHYLAEERKLPQSIIRHFGLGYSPASFGALTEHMHKTGYTDEELKVGFLAATSAKTGRPYDYFRNRVIFPIIDTNCLLYTSHLHQGLCRWREVNSSGKTTHAEDAGFP